MKPRRIQLSRRKGWRKPAGAVVVSRPSRWGNPYRLEDYQFESRDGVPVARDYDGARAMAVRDFEAALALGGILPFTEEDVRRELRGKDLACWCPLPDDGRPDICHAAVLLAVANQEGRP